MEVKVKMATLSRVKIVRVTKALAAAGAYAAGDVLSENATTGTSWTFSGCARDNGRGGRIVNSYVQSETTNLTPRLVLYLFNATPTSALNDNVANTAIIHADLTKKVATIAFGAMSENGGDSEAYVSPVELMPKTFICAATDTSLYGVLVTLDAVTQTATDDMTVVLEIEQE